MKSRFWKIGTVIMMMAFILTSLLPGGMVRAADTASYLYVKIVSSDQPTITPKTTFNLSLGLSNTTSGAISDMAVSIASGDFGFSDGRTIVQVAGTIAGNGDLGISLPMIYLGEGSTSALGLTFSYKVNGGTTEYQTLNVRINGVKAATVDNSPPAEPKMTVSNQTIPEITAGQDSTITFDVKNTSYAQANDVTITPDLGTGLDGKVTLGSGTFLPSGFTLNAATTSQITLRIKADYAVTSGTYPITLNFKYKGSTGTTAYTATQTVYIKVVNTAVKPDLTISGPVMTPAMIALGKDLKLDFTVKNEGTLTAKNVSVSLTGLDGKTFIYKDSQLAKSVGTLKGSATGTVSYQYVVSGKAEAGSYPYTLVISYTDTDGTVKKIEQSYSLYISATGEAVVGDADLQIDAINYPTAGVKAMQDFKVTFNVVNRGNNKANKVKITLKSSGALVSKTSTILTKQTVAAGETIPVSYTLTSSKDITTQNVPLVFEVSYVPNGQTEAVTFEQGLGVFVEGALSPEEAKKSVPKIIVSRYQADPVIVNAGEEFNLDISFLNSHPTKTVQNIKVFLTVNENTSELGNIFTPVNASNTFYIDAISPKGTYDTSIRLYTIPDAKPKTYSVTVNFDYEDQDGNTYTSTELIGINVTQPTKLESSDIVPPMEAYVGQQFPLSFNFYNTGKVKVYNLMVKLEGDFTTDNPTYYVGNFESGAQEYYEGYVTPNAAGQLMGKAIISYDEPSGKKVTIEKAFSVNVVDMGANGGMVDPGMVDPGMVDPGMVPEKTGLFSNKYVLYGAIGGGILLVIIIFVVIRGILKKRREKLDEI